MRQRNDIAVGSPVPPAFGVGKRVGHADFQLGLGAGFDALATVETEKIWNTNPLDLYILPYLVTHRAAFQFDGLVAFPLKFGKYSAGTDGTYGEFFEETLVCFE